MIALVGVLVLPFAELWTFVAVAGQIGWAPAVLALVALSALGFVLIRSQGLAVWRRANAELAAGRMPTRSLSDGLMVVVGGLLLIVPGFITAAVGLLFMLAPVRSLVRPVLLRRMERRAARAGVMNAVFVGPVGSPYSSTRSTRSPWGAVIGGTIVDVESREAEPSAADIVDVHVNGPAKLDPPG